MTKGVSYERKTLAMLDAAILPSKRDPGPKPRGEGQVHLTAEDKAIALPAMGGPLFRIHTNANAAVARA